MQRVLEALSALRNGGRNKLVQFGAFRVHIHQALDEFAREFLQRSRGVGSRRLPDDLRSVLPRAELVERGVEVSEVQDFPWGSFVFFSDPDGNGWAVQQVPARS